MAQMTSAMAAKYLKKLNEEHDALLRREKKTMTFTAAIQENREEVRPEYNYSAVQVQLLELERKIRAVKHEISLFNLNQSVPGFDMTVDQMLVYIPQSTQEKISWSECAAVCPENGCRTVIAGTPPLWNMSIATMTSRRWQPIIAVLQTSWPVRRMRWIR